MPIKSGEFQFTGISAGVLARTVFVLIIRLNLCFVLKIVAKAGAEH